MKILVVGGGGREHAIVKKLKESPKHPTLYCCPGNGGIAEDAECSNIRATDIDTMVAYAKQREIDFVVVAPDDPLVLEWRTPLKRLDSLYLVHGKTLLSLKAARRFQKN